MEQMARGYAAMAIIASDTGAGPRKSGGGKLSRSETVTVRLDPKLNYLCDLAARAQRRTKSSFIEWSISEALKSVVIPGTADSYGENDQSADDLAGTLWDVDEVDRLLALAFHAPVLMTHEEQLIWKIIKTSDSLWYGRWSGEIWKYDDRQRSNIVMHRLREKWETIRAVADGSEERSAHWQLNRLTKDRSDKGEVADSSKNNDPFGVDLDDDVPF